MVPYECIAVRYDGMIKSRKKWMLCGNRPSVCIQYTAYRIVACDKRLQHATTYDRIVEKCAENGVKMFAASIRLLSHGKWNSPLLLHAYDTHTHRLSNRLNRRILFGRIAGKKSERKRETSATHGYGHRISHQWLATPMGCNRDFSLLYRPISHLKFDNIIIIWFNFMR